MEPEAFAQVAVAVFAILGGHQGIEYYKRKRILNGNGNDRRRNSMSDSDRGFVVDLFTKLELGLENDRLKMTRDLEKTISDESQKTRDVVRSV